MRNRLYCPAAGIYLAAGLYLTCCVGTLPVVLASEHSANPTVSKSAVHEKSSIKNSSTVVPGAKQVMQISSPVLKEGQAVPSDFAVDGADVSPPLTWVGAPSTAKSLAVVVDDPDAPGGIWYHWIIFNIAPKTNHLEQNIAKIGSLQNGMQQGTNDFGKIGYNGPAPPRGALHHYRFKLLALDTWLPLSAGAKKDAFARAIAGHVIAQTQLTSTYRH